MGAPGFLGGMLAFILIIWVGLALGVNYYVDYQYEVAMGSYMETATDTITPESGLPVPGLLMD
jgi:hypothetical protein